MTTSSFIVIPELENARIRRTDDGRVSVFDLIAVIGGQKNSREPWKRLCKIYTEVVTKCDNLQFPGAGQRLTPVVTRENALYIIGLLPGTIGKKYREFAANLVIRYLDADISVAEEVVDRNDNPEDLERLETRIKGKRGRRRFTDALQAVGLTDGQSYAVCTNGIYRGGLGETAQGLRKKMKLRKRDNVRDHLSLTELSIITLSENVAADKLLKVQPTSLGESEKICYGISAKIKKVIDEIQEA